MREGRCRTWLAGAAWLLVPTAVSAGNGVALGSTSGYGNLHAGGVVVTVAGDDDRDGTVTLEWRVAGGSFRAAHPLTRIDATHFVGSLFGLSPGTTYEARITLTDPDGVTGATQATVALQTRPEALPEPTLRTLYVAPNGNDANNGTSPSTPLRTVQRAADLSQPGDLILIAPGVYRERVSVTVSGTASQPIVFRGSGAGAVLDGADAAIAAGVSWTNAGGGVYSRAIGFATGHVVADTGRLFSYGNLAELQALAAGAPGGFFFDGTQLYVRFSDGSSPAARTLHVARLEDGFFLDGVSHVRIENLEIRHYGSGAYGKGIYLRYASDCAVRQCRIHEVGAAGVWAKGGERHRIEDNEIWDTSILNWPWSSTKGSSAENNAISLSDELGQGHVIRRNTVHGTFNGIAPCGSTAPSSAFTTEVDAYDNVLYQHTDDAFEPEGYCANVRLWGNRIRDVHMAFAVAPAAPGPVYILRNVASGIGNTRTSQLDGYTASALKINSGYPTPVGPLLVYHNTFLAEAAGTDAIALLQPGYSTFVRARNNVVAGTRYALYKLNPVPWDGDRDDLYTTAASRLVYWEGTRYDTLAAFRSGTGQEPSGMSAAPALVNPAAGDFRPQASSPLVDRAVALAGINDTFAGAGPDIGALEADSVRVSIDDRAVAEGGAVNASFRVTLSAGSSQTVTVAYATADGTAFAGSDYTATSGTLTFTPGRTAHSIAVPILTDGVAEGTETFYLNLTSASGATILDNQAVGSISDPPAAANVFMYRCYNPTADYHFFTTSEPERGFAVANGYRDENSPTPPFRVPNTGASGATAIFRMYNPNSGRHYYTASGGERDSLEGVGWVYEKDEGFVHASAQAGTAEVFRLYNTNSGVHLYTARADEKDLILALFPGIWFQHTSLGHAYPP